MKGVLTRLVARGKGVATPGLSPRLAARFEASTDDWGTVTENSGDALFARPAPEAATQEQQRTIPSVATVPPERKTDPMRPSQTPESTQPPPTLLLGQTTSLSPPTEPSGATGVSVAEQEVEAELRSSPEALLPDVDAKTEHKQATEDPIVEEVPEQLLEVSKPPSPLLPPDSESDSAATRPAPFGGLPLPQPAVAALNQKETPEVREPPEIVVHIGRIDVRTAPAPQTPAKPPRTRRPQMTPLGDYLKSRGGAG